MPTSDFIIKQFLLEFMIFTNLGYVFPRSVPSLNQRPTPQFEHHFQSSLALHPFRYDHSNLQAYRLPEPVGTFYDSKRGILRSFPGGGVPVLVDHHKRCSSNFVGIKPHPNQRQYYYVCKPDCVIFGKCQNLQSFDAMKAQCIPNSTPDYNPVCTKPGSFPISTDCTIYYRCDAQLKSRIYSCPQNTVFSPHNERCICGAHCNPTKVSAHGSHIPQDSEHKFPPCLQDGTFRTPTDCALYYTCAKQQGPLYLQTRFKCPELEFFDPAQGTCRPQHEVACDSIQLSELVFPRPPPMPNLPVIYPAHYSMDSLDDSEYPTEYSLSCSKEDTVSASVSSSEGTSSDSSAQTTKSAKRSTVLTTVTTVIPSDSIKPKEVSLLKISTSTLKLDDISTSTLNPPTPSSFPTSTISIKSTIIDENSHDQMFTSVNVSNESLPPAAFPTTNSISAGSSSSTASSLNPSAANFVTTLSTDIISGSTSSPTNFLSLNIHTGESHFPISPSAFSSTSSFRDPTFKPMLNTNVTTTNTILASTAEINTTPVVSTSITSLPTTGDLTSTTRKRPFPTTAQPSSPLINKVDNSSPNVLSSSVGIIRTTTIPTFSSSLNTSLPITTLSPLDLTTTDPPTHSNTPFVETAAQTSRSMPIDPPMSSPATSNLREVTTTMSPNTESLTKGSSVTTSSILSDSPSNETNESKVKPTVSSAEQTPDTITNTLSQNEVRSIRSSLLTGSVTAEENHALEKAVDIEYNSNEFENLGYYDDYELISEDTEISTTNKSAQSDILDDNIKPLNISSLITNTENDNNTAVNGTEGVVNNSHDGRFSNDVSYYEDIGDYFEELSSSTVSGPRIEMLSTAQSTSLKLNSTPLSTRSAKRGAPNYNFQIHNKSDKQTNDKSDITDMTFVTTARSDTEVSKCAIQSIEMSTEISPNEYELGSNSHIAITTPFSESVSSIRTESNHVYKNVAHLHAEDSTVVESSTESNLSDLKTASNTTSGYIATVSSYEDSGDIQTKTLTKVQTKNIEKFSKGTTNENLTNSSTPAIDFNTFTFARNFINNIDETLVIDNEIQILAENSTKINKGEESTNSSKISFTVIEKDDIDIPQTVPKSSTEPTTFKVARQAIDQINNSFELSNENEIFTESPSIALFTVKSEIEAANITESSLETTTATEVLSTEKIYNKHHTPKDLLETRMISSTAPTVTIVNHTTYYEQEANAKVLLSSSTEVNLTVRDLKKPDPIPNLVDILIPPHTQKPSQKNKRVVESINFGKNYTNQDKSHTNPQYLKMDRYLNYATTVSTPTETPNPKEIVINHFESAVIDVMSSTEPEKPFNSFEKSTGLIKIKDRFQNNNSNEGDNQENSQAPNSKPKSLRNNVIFKTRTNDLLSQSTTTPNTIITVKEKYQENTTVRTTYLDIKFQDNLVNIESNDLRIARNVPNTKTLQDTPQIYKGIYRTQTPVSNSNSETVTGFPNHATDIPKLEVVVFGNLDLTVLYCPKDCSKQHEHKYDKKFFGDQHVVGIQWDPAKTRKTMSIQTV
ncbi:mucin-2-like isoform X2 [Zeugodacus cucurbitae]|uniref:mucin-2-like isoform X2 n=1 Tax=Zeugodacus cucurbitae TaxID=28588 RepID=UPI0023D95DA9|nr:mucin-2-like isoform X2 [Zeugodacus cucurbitae]